LSTPNYQDPASELSPEGLERLLYLKDIPAPSGIAQEILHIAGDDQVDLGYVASLVEKSPEITTRILRYANSAFFGERQLVRSPREAIIRVLGLSLTKSLMLAMAVGSTFNATSFPGFLQVKHWFTAIAAATFSQALSPHIHGNDLPAHDAAYTTGLLHNFGVLALICAFPAQMKEIFADPSKGHLRDKTRAKLGLDHLIVGGWLARRWGFPEELCQAVTFHNQPSYNGPHQTIVLLTGFSAELANHLHQDDKPQNWGEMIPKRLSIPTSLVDKVYLEISERRPELTDMALLLAGD